MMRLECTARLLRHREMIISSSSSPSGHQQHPSDLPLFGILSSRCIMVRIRNCQMLYLESVYLYRVRHQYRRAWYSGLSYISESTPVFTSWFLAEELESAPIKTRSSRGRRISSDRHPMIDKFAEESLQGLFTKKSKHLMLGSQT